MSPQALLTGTASIVLINQLRQAEQGWPVRDRLLARNPCQDPAGFVEVVDRIHS